MKVITIIHLVGESGSVIVFGKKSEDHWEFWTEESSCDADADTLSAPAVQKSSVLANLLPGHWLMMQPIEIHREFIPWLHKHYLQSLDAMDAADRSRYDWQLQDRWEGALSLHGI